MPPETSPSPIQQIAVHANSPMVTLINVFTVAPERQQELCDLIDQTMADVMRRQPGFIAGSVHRGLDGTRVVNYVQWASLAAFEAMGRVPAALAGKEEVERISTMAPALYIVNAVHVHPAS